MFKSKEKIFCIGLNKTGTTSLGVFFENNGFKVEKQKNGELMLQNYLDRNFKDIIKKCNRSRSQVFQDVPHSLPYTFVHLDTAFPNSKFILTIRNSPKDWYNSILSFHSFFFNKGLTPTYESLISSNYIYKGWAWEMMNDVFFKGNQELYKREDLIHVYERHNQNVIDYFRNKPKKLLVIDLSIRDDFDKLCDFINIKSKQKDFPNITSKSISEGNYSCDFLKN